MVITLEEAQKAFEEGTYPIGEVIIDDDDYGGIRKFKEGTQFLHLFDTLLYVASPYLDLENNQSELLAKWNISRGFINTEWEKIKG